MTTRLSVLVLLLGLALASESLAANDRCKQTKIIDEGNSLRHLVPNRWWETTAGMKVVTLKPCRGRQLSLESVKALEQLDQIKAQGFQAIEIYAPAEGLQAYGGLDTKNHYRIDPELGTMDDFRRLVRLAHAKGLAVVVFINIGYFSAEAPDWIEACRDKKSKKDSEKVKWFSWADQPDTPPPGAEDTQFYVQSIPVGGPDKKAKTWGWQYSELAGAYYWARWRAKVKDGNYVALAQNDWGFEEWQNEAERIVRFWMNTGIDGMRIDAPIFYTGLTWEQNRRHITDVIASYGNTFSQPEGSRDVAWITDGGYNSIQDDGLRLWGNKWQQKNSIITALETGNPRPIEESLRNYHDKMVAAGAVLYLRVRTSDDLSKSHLVWATVATIGDLVASYSDTDGEETWILETKQLHPALHQLSTRRKLQTNADDKYYAFLRTAADGSERILVVLNFQPKPQTVEVDLSGVATTGLVELKNCELIERQNPFKVELPVYGYRFYQILSAKKLP